MHGFKIRIFHFAKAVIDELLDAAAAVFLDDVGAFANGVAVWNSILVFCDAHENASFSFFFNMEKRRRFYAPNGEICFVYFPLQKEKVIGNL